MVGGTGGNPSLSGGGSSGAGGGAVTAAAASYAAGALLQLPSVLGATTKAGSVSFAFATDQLLPGFAATPTFNLGTAPSLAVTGTFFQGTQPVSASALPLPTGASTAALQPAINADAGSQVHVQNFPATQPVSLVSAPLPALAAQDGVDGTSITAPTGGSGIRGWLSGIYKAVTGTLTVSGTVTANAGSGTMAVSAASLPLPAGAMGSSGGSVGVTNFPTTADTNTGAAGASTIRMALATGSTVAATMSAAVTGPTSTLTLPATTTAYGSGQLVASSATAGSVVVPSFAIANTAGGAAIGRLRLSVNDATATAWPAVKLQVDLWTAAPTFTNGDRGAFLPATGVAGHLAAFTCTMSAEYGDGAYAECSPAVGSYVIPKLASGTTVYWTLQTAAAGGLTGASKVFTLTAETLN